MRYNLASSVPKVELKCQRCWLLGAWTPQTGSCLEQRTKPERTRGSGGAAARVRNQRNDLTTVSGWQQTQQK